MPDNRKHLFMADLQELLNKHKAELYVGDDGAEYGQQRGECIIVFNFVPDLPYCEFALPTYMAPEKVENENATKEI